MLVALGAIRVTLDGRRQAEPCPHCRRGGLQGSRRPGVDEFGRRGKYCERCGRWAPDRVPRSSGWVRLVNLPQYVGSWRAGTAPPEPLSASSGLGAVGDLAVPGRKKGGY